MSAAVDDQDVFAQMFHDRRRATQILKAQAKEGIADAMFMLGYLKWRSNRAVSEQEGVDWLKQAVKRKHVYAKLYLGRAYFTGRGIRQNRPLGLRLLGESADAGCAEAMMELAEEYLDSDSSVKDYRQGIRRLKQAANAGDPLSFAKRKSPEQCDSYAEFIEVSEGEAISSAQEYLAILYEAGEKGIKQDLAQAAHWIAKVYASGFVDHGWALIELYRKLGKSDQVEPILITLSEAGDPEAKQSLADIWKTSRDPEKQRLASRLELEARKAGVRREPDWTSPKEPVISELPAPRRVERPDAWLDDLEYTVKYGSPDDKLSAALKFLLLEPADERAAIRILDLPDMIDYEPAREKRKELVQKIGRSAYEILRRKPSS